MRVSASVAVLIAAFTTVAEAQTARQLIQEFGLIGVWAPNCAMPPSLTGGNAKAIYALSSNGNVMLTYDGGAEGQAASYYIVNAMRSGKDRLTYTAERVQDRRRVTVTVARTDSAITLVSSVAEDGTVLIQNGKKTASGSLSVPQLRCTI